MCFSRCVGNPAFGAMAAYATAMGPTAARFMISKCMAKEKRAAQMTRLASWSGPCIGSLGE